MSALSEEVQFITVVDVRDYAYCPRVVYFTRVLHLRERVTEAMEYGRERHEEPPLALDAELMVFQFNLTRLTADVSRTI